MRSSIQLYNLLSEVKGVLMNGKQLLIMAAVALAVVIGVNQYQARKAQG